MKIIAPVKRASDTLDLIRSGADELFGSVYDEQWESEFGPYLEYNRRGSYGINGSCRSWEELKEILNVCEEEKVPFSLAVNALRINASEYTLIRRIIEKFINIGGKKLIISDISAMKTAHDLGLDITVSSCANCFSVETVRYYFNTGIRSIIFPRDVSISEMQIIAKSFSEMEFEAFGMYSGCRFSDGNCLGSHSTPYRELCNFCDTGDWCFEKTDGSILERDEKMYLENLNQRFSLLLRNACGQCALFLLNDIVTRIKILDRIGSVERLKDIIALTKKNLAIMSNCKSNEEYLSKMIIPSSVDCSSGNDCYYHIIKPGE